MNKFFFASLLAFLSSSALAKDTELPPAQAEVVAAERAFARVAGELGFQQSFIAFFADEGIGFGPHPFKMKETLIRQAPLTALCRPRVIHSQAVRRHPRAHPADRGESAAQAPAPQP